MNGFGLRRSAEHSNESRLGGTNSSADFSTVERRPGSETLRTTLDRQGWLEPEQAIRIVRQLADQLEYAHADGILHLRIQPDNIVLDPDGAVVLADPGQEKGSGVNVADLTRGCPIHYISPEEASGKTPDARSDLYSLGVVFYQMLTDRLPVDSEDLDTVKQRHLTHSPMAPHLYCSGIPVSLSAVVMRMLEKDPNERFQDVASFRAALETSIGQAPAPMIWSDESAGQPAGPEDYRHPNDVESLLSTRESWEPPSIRVIDPPIPEIPVYELETESSEERNEPYTAPARIPGPRQPVEPVQTRQAREHLEIRRYGNGLPRRELSYKFELSSQWRPLLLVLALALAALSGLIVLARADRTSAPTQRLPETAGESRSEAASDGAVAMPASSGADEKAAVTDPPAPSDGQSPAGASPGAAVAPAAGGATQASTAAGSQQVSAKPSSKSRRVRQRKRRWRQPTQYFRSYGDAGRRYYRRGER